MKLRRVLYSVFKFMQWVIGIDDGSWDDDYWNGKKNDNRSDMSRFNKIIITFLLILVPLTFISLVLWHIMQRAS